MATFKCLRSGNTISLNDPEDVERMKTHEGYILVNQGDNHEDASPQDAQAQPDQTAEAKEVKQRGRPKKHG